MSSQIYDEKIPQGWEVVKLGDVAKITMGQSPDGATYSNSPSKYILIQGNADIQNGFVKPRIWTTQITKIAYVGNIIMSVRAPAGAIAKTEYDAVIGRGVAAIEGNDFIYHILIKMDKDGYWDEFSCGSTFDSLKSYDIFNAKILMPKEKAEQDRIARVLGDMDDLISAKCELLDKKRAIKQASAQQLLTPKPHWHTATLGNVGEIITGSTPSTTNEKFWNGDIAWITPTDIGDKKDIFTGERSITQDGLKATRELPENSLLVTCIASIGKNAVLKVKGSCNQQINALIPNKNFNVDFLYYLLEFEKERLKNLAGITATLIISKALFSKFEISYPNFTEQTKIAQILSDIDDEISALQDEIEKLKMIKQGAMDELLSGKIRLKG